MTRIAVLGYGSSGQRHVATVQKRLKKPEILVYSSQKLAATSFTTTSTLSDVTKFQPDAAIISGIVPDRVAMVDALPESTAGVLIEKPLAMDVREGVIVLEALSERRMMVQIGYNLRYSASLREFKQRIDSRDLGKLWGVRAETGQYLPDWRPGRDYRGTASAREERGGGVLRELSHELDYLRWIFGDVRWVAGWTGRQSQLEIDVADTAHLNLGFVDHMGLPVVGQLSLDFVRHDRTRSITAICERGTLRWDGVALRVEEWRESGSKWDSLYTEEKTGPTTYELQWDSFHKALQGGFEPEVTGDDGLEVLRMVDAVNASHNSDGARQLLAKSEVTG